MQNLKQKYPKFAEAIVKIFAIMGLVIIILIALYGAMAALRSIPNVWESVGNAFTSVTGIFDGEDEMELSVSPQTPVSGEVITISFDRKGSNSNGSTSFSYECVEGVNFEILSPVGNSRTFAFCNTPTTFGTSTGTSGDYVQVIATLINKEIVSVPIKIEFTKNNESEPSASGETKITVLKTSGGSQNGNGTTNPPATTTPPTTKPPVSNPPTGNPGYVIVPAPRVPNLYGFADLKVNILEVGTINKFTGVFTKTSNISINDRVAVKFEVVNIGTNISGNWRFNAALPIEPAYLYPAGTQPQLFPGDKIIYTLGFDNIQNRSISQFTVIVDPDNQVIESNELNNTATTNISLNQAQSGNVYLPIGGSSCTAQLNGTYTCAYNGLVYINCYTNGNGFTCQNNTTTGSTYNLPFGSNCYATGVNSAYTCYVGSTTYTNCFVTTAGYTCYNTNTGGTGNYTLPTNASCYVSNSNGRMTCTYNNTQYTDCYLTISNTYSCTSISGNNQTGNYQLPSNSSCAYQSNGSYNCSSTNGNYYSGCYLNSNGWNCSTLLGTNNQNGCYTTPSGYRVCY